MLVPSVGHLCLSLIVNPYVFLINFYCSIVASLVTQWLRIQLPKQEMGAQSLGQEAPLEKKMATHSSILAWRIPWIEEPGGLQSRGLQRVGYD